MTYPIDFRKQVMRSIKDGMTIREGANFYQLSRSTIHSWEQDLFPKTIRNKAPTKISNEALLKDVEQHPHNYMYERAQRLRCSKSVVESALKRLVISQKKTLKNPKAYLIKRPDYLSKLNDFMASGFAIVYKDESDFEYETSRPHGYASIGRPFIDSYNWQAKTALTSLVPCTKKCYLRLITLIKILMATYFIVGTNTHSFQV